VSDEKVTIIIPCYKQQNYLQRAFESLAQQNYSDIEVIVIDDGSPEAVELPPGEWWFETHLIRQDNAGLSVARNAGLARATGRYVKFLDADDTLMPECLSQQVAVMGKRDDVISVIGFIEEDESTGKRKKILPAFGDIREALLKVNIGPPHCYLYSRKSIEAIGGFSTDTRVDGGHEDYDLALRLAVHGCYGVTVHRPGVIYYKRSGSMSHNYGAMMRTRAAVWAANLPQILSSEDDEQHSILLAALFAWVYLLSVVPEQFGSPLRDAAKILAEEVVRVDGLPAAEMSMLNSLLSRGGGAAEKEVLDALATVRKIHSNTLFHPQELIDRRIGVTIDGHTAAVYEQLINTLASMTDLSENFSIYGAGEIGQRLARALMDAGMVPMSFIDRMAYKGQVIAGIPVQPPDREVLASVNAVIIASEKYYEDIHQHLMTHYPEVKIINQHNTDHATM